MFDRWAIRMGDHGITDAEASAHFAAWAEEDTYFPLEPELGALPGGGLDEVELLLATRGVLASRAGCAAAERPGAQPRIPWPKLSVMRLRH